MTLLERDGSLRTLADLLAGARHGRGHVALVVGDAGMGKTALVDAFCGQAPTATRVLWGTCDPIRPSRPFAPIIDIADRVGGELRRSVASGQRDAVLDAFLAMLRRHDRGPTIVVLDDLQWADDATLEVLRVVGRRAARLPMLLVGTYRDHDVDTDHPLRAALGDVSRSAVTEIPLQPLSVAAVQRLARSKVDGVALHRLTAGNPFFVTEVLAAGAATMTSPRDHVPVTVRDAVLTRVARLSASARQALRAAAVLGPSTDLRTVLDVAGEPREALDEGVAHALLVLDGGNVSFQHELARRAVLDGLPRDEAVRLHRTAYEILRTPPLIDQPRIARHAIAAGDADAILASAPGAGRSAEALGARREATEFYAAALAHGGRLEPRERADLLERYARQASLTGDIPRALEAQQAALSAWRSVADGRRVGVCLTDLSGMLWLAGETDSAMSTAAEATKVLEAVAPGSVELAWAWAVVAQRLLVWGGRDAEAIAVATRAIRRNATRAIRLATRVGDEHIVVHALTTMAVASIYDGDDRGWSSLEGAVERARTANLVEDTLRSMINLAEAARDFRRYDLAERSLATLSAFLDEHDLDLDLYRHMLRSRVAALELEVGRWDAALADVGVLLELRSVANPVRVRALTIRGLVRARRGEPGASADLDEALALREVETQDLLPLRAARAEAAWLLGDEALARAEATEGLAVGPREQSPWWWSELAFWSWRAGASTPLPHADEAPYWLHAMGRHREAAMAWAAIGAPYQEAFALADSHDEIDLRGALRIFNGLGAWVMARRVAERLTGLGADRIDRGPRPRTRGNPAMLTPREVEVLGLLADGLTNGAIAGHLVVSTRTVDHHVASILRKLDVRDRVAAVAAARHLGLVRPAEDRASSPAR